MKKLLIFLLSATLVLSGCSNNSSSDTKEPVNLKKVDENIVQAKLNDDGNIVIKKSSITDKATYISYDVDGAIVGLLAVRDSKDNIKVVVNTCSSCGGAPYAYFVQVDDYIECQNCGNRFSISELDNLDSDGCNPIKIEDMTEYDNNIIIGVEQLKKLKDKFENWKGPKE